MIKFLKRYNSNMEDATLNAAYAIIEQLDTALKDDRSTLAICIKWGIQRKVSPLEVIKEIKEMADNNYVMVAGIVGYKLTNAILTFKTNPHE